MDGKLKAIAETALSGLGMIKRVIDLGGPITSLIPYADTVAKTIGYLQTAAEFGKEIAPDVEEFINTFSDPNVTPEMMAALDARIAEKEAKLDAPLPDRDPNEPE